MVGGGGVGGAAWSLDLALPVVSGEDEEADFAPLSVVWAQWHRLSCRAALALRLLSLSPECLRCQASVLGVGVGQGGSGLDR